MHWKLLPRISVQACNNAEKWTPGAPKTTPRPLETLQNPARRLRNRRRSASRRSKSGQGRQQTQQETQNALKKHPRSKNGANMAPRDLRKLRMSGPPSRRTPPLKVYTASILSVRLTRRGTCKQVRRTFGGLDPPQRIKDPYNLRSKI